MVAVEARHQAAINAWPDEPLLRTKGERLKTGHVQAGPRAMAGWSAVVNVCWPGPDGDGRTAAGELPCRKRSLFFLDGSLSECI